ncbi:hypothetical protein [Streptococcus suis]|uniref:hypothetical protein n=1 Tax=Streptococcus suis TaxID=1307 RepID=UPI0015C56335|nr:hypothetical protein [Streptococcus suis]
MFQRIIALYLRFLFQLEYSAMSLNIVFNVVITLLLLPFYLLFFKGLGIESKDLKVDTIDKELRKTFRWLNASFITYFLLVRITTQAEIWSQRGMIVIDWNPYYIRTNILLLYFAIFIVSMLYLNYQKKEKQAREIQELKDKQITDLGRYRQYVKTPS